MAESGVGADAIGVVDLVVPAPVFEGLPVDPTAEAELAEKIVRRFVALCEHPVSRRLMVRMAKGCVGDARGAGRLGNRFTGLVFSRLGPGSRGELTMLRIELITVQLAGMAIVRYALELEPMASLATDELVALVTPQVAAALRSDTTVAARLAASTPRATTSPAVEPRALYKVTGRPG